jgi:hypothetical protein
MRQCDPVRTCGLSVVNANVSATLEKLSTLVQISYSKEAHQGRHVVFADVENLSRTNESGFWEFLTAIERGEVPGRPNRTRLPVEGAAAPD